jgi:hypothetical protein
MGDSLWTLRILFAVVFVAVLYWIWQARRGRAIHIRRIPGLNNIDEAVGRSVEMGRPCVFGSGIFGLESVPTLAALALMQYVADLCAKLGTRLIVPVCVENVLPATQSICEAESLMFGETGQALGAIQIAGTEQLFQIPFFIATCDYVLIAEEFYAASAFLSRDPVMAGSIAGQDIAKAVFLTIVVLLAVSATIAALRGLPEFANWLSVLLGR